MDIATVERSLHELYVAAAGAGLRREDLKKAREVSALLSELARAGLDGLLVDAAAGKAYVGLLAVQLLGATRVAVIERDAARAEACRAAATRLRVGAEISVIVADVGDAGAWPADPRVVVALHACGDASDTVLDAAVRARARWLFLVPCCYSASVPFAAVARVAADRAGIPRHAEVRRRFVTAMVDAERTLRLEAAGYETTVVPFVPPTVTPHNLLWRARRAAEAGRMRDATEQLARLRALGEPPP